MYIYIYIRNYSLVLNYPSQVPMEIMTLGMTSALSKNMVPLDPLVRNSPRIGIVGDLWISPIPGPKTTSESPKTGLVSVGTPREADVSGHFGRDGGRGDPWVPFLGAGWAQMFWIQLSSNFNHIWNPKLPRHSGRGDFMFYLWHSENPSFWLESGENFAQPPSKFKEIERCGAIPTLNTRWPFASGIHHSFTSKKECCFNHLNGEILGEIAYLLGKPW